MKKRITRVRKTVFNKTGDIKAYISKESHDKKIRKYTLYNYPIKLDLGCGSSKREGFIGIDLSPEADIQWDLTQGLPFEDETVSVIRSDHFFEHLELTDLIKLLKECRRVLIPGGTLDFSVPHLDPYLAAYLSKNYNFLRDKINDVPDGEEILYNTCFDRISWLLLRNGEHKSMFDKDSIIAKVKLAGFNIVTTREYDPKKDINPRFSSIYVVAIK